MLISTPVVSLLLFALLFYPNSLYAAQTIDTSTEPPTTGISQRSIGPSEATVEAAFQGCSGPHTAATKPAFEQQVVELTNAERAKAGLPPLKLNAELSTAMRDHAMDMVQDDYFAHDSHDRNGGQLIQVCAWSERIRSYVPDAGAIAENIAWGYDSPEMVVQAWMESDGHRANLLRGHYTEVGVSYYATRWGQDFAQRSDVYPVVINREASDTGSTNVRIYAYGDWTQMRLRNDGGTWSSWQPFTNWISWEINAIAGKRTVDIEMTDGQTTVASRDRITYTGETTVAPPPRTVRPATNNQVFLPLALR